MEKLRLQNERLRNEVAELSRLLRDAAKSPPTMTDPRNHRRRAAGRRRHPHLDAIQFSKRCLTALQEMTDHPTGG